MPVQFRFDNFLTAHENDFYAKRSGGVDCTLDLRPRMLVPSHRIEGYGDHVRSLSREPLMVRLLPLR